VAQVNHLRRVVLIWLVASVIIDPLIIIFFAPTVPPGQGSVQASGQVLDNTILFGLATPIALAVLIFFIYALIVFREPDPAAVVEGPAIRGHAGIQLWWMIITVSTVLFLAGYASYRTLVDGAGGGQGPNPVVVPTGAHGLVNGQPPVQVQVIAQQWQFTYRYPQYGGVETDQLELPAFRLIAFHVTSLDVVHSFWAYQLGVKADANPNVDNVAYVKTQGPVRVDVHCAELCGVWHGYMFNTGHVVTGAQFASWIQSQEQRFKPIEKFLPPYHLTYNPAPTRRGG
jgi:cytochrome c oxidase subunit II